jgi:hypothetical protein
MMGVDPELVKWQLDYAAFFHRSSTNWVSLSRVLTQTKTFAKYYSSERALVESLVRGADGDPFGTARDALERQHKLQDEWDRLITAQNDLAAQEAELFAVGHRLTVDLRNKYQVQGSP